MKEYFDDEYGLKYIVSDRRVEVYEDFEKEFEIRIYGSTAVKLMNSDVRSVRNYLLRSLDSVEKARKRNLEFTFSQFLALRSENNNSMSIYEMIEKEQEEQEDEEIEYKKKKNAELVKTALKNAKEYNCCVYERQSTSKSAEVRYFAMEESLKRKAKRLGFDKPYVLKLEDFSGFYSAQVVKLLLKEFKVIFVSEISRLSRNLVELLKLLQYAYINHKKIYLNDKDITSGKNRLLAVLEAYFAELELFQKQTNFANYTVEFFEWLVEEKEFDNCSMGGRKLILLAQNTELEGFIIYFMKKASKVIETSKNEKLVSDAKRVIKLGEKWLSEN